MKKVAIILVLILLIIAGVFAYNHISTSFATFKNFPSLESELPEQAVKVMTENTKIIKNFAYFFMIIPPFYDRLSDIAVAVCQTKTTL